MSDATWVALTVTLTLIGALWTFYAFRNRGVASGLRGAGFTLLPAAAYLTGTLEMFTEIGQSVFDWATHLVFSPIVWAGVALGGISLLLFMVSTGLRERGRGGQPAAKIKAPTEKGRLNKSSQPTSAVMDDDMADIEAILRKRGIS
ncbi:hypothetical protein [Nocardioides sp. InS609-2]|uniref:hypothetical protein n=1 Tax=Nocardioides sp. InS609-2 TaxID=2760705 RepID=UPI0020BDC6AD|nr:hypothetical protein [Nocardioides sp. InS609-2]